MKPVPNNYTSHFKDELKEDEKLMWSDISYSDKNSVYAFTNKRIFIKKYKGSEKFKLRAFEIKEIPNIVLIEDDIVGTIKFGGSDPMRENALAWGGKATVIQKFESIKNAQEVYREILNLQYGVVDES